MTRLAGVPNSRVDQIALLVPDLKAAMDAYIATFGVTFAVFEASERNSTFSGSSAQFQIDIAVGIAGLLSIELIQPVSGATLYSRHLASRGAGLHHVGVYVDNLAKAMKSLARRGYERVLEGRITGLGEFAYFEAPQMHCIVEVLQLSVSLPLFLWQNARVYPAKTRTVTVPDTH